MRTGTEIRVGFITLLAVALLVVFTFYITGYRPVAATYPVRVTFDDARGLQRGDPVRMLGVKIGEVRKVEIVAQMDGELKAEVTLTIDQERELHSNYIFQITTAGLIQERFVEVIVQPYDPYRVRLTGDEPPVAGAATTDLNDILEASSDLIKNLKRTSRQLSLALSDENVAGMKVAIESFTELAEVTSALTREAQPGILAALQEVRTATADLRATTAELRTRLTEGPAFDDIEQAARHARRVAANAERITGDVAGLTSDPKVQEQLRSTLAAVHNAAQSAEKAAADLEVLSGELRRAAPSIPRVAKEAVKFADASADFRERLKPPQIDAAFDVLYSPEAKRSFSSGRLDIKTSEERFLRFGIDDIGEGSDVNIQLGEPQRRAVLRYGLVRSRLGMGFDFDLPREGTLSLDLFDPNNLHADILADVPFVPGRFEWRLLAGVRDVGDDGHFVGGIRLEK